MAAHQLDREAVYSQQIDDRKLDLYRLLSLISKAKGDGRAPQPLAEGRGDDYDLAAHLVFDRYQRALRAMGMVDFDDLLALPARASATRSGGSSCSRSFATCWSTSTRTPTRCSSSS